MSMPKKRGTSKECLTRSLAAQKSANMSISIQSDGDQNKSLVYASDLWHTPWMVIPPTVTGCDDIVSWVQWKLPSDSAQADPDSRSFPEPEIPARLRRTRACLPLLRIPLKSLTTPGLCFADSRKGRRMQPLQWPGKTCSQLFSFRLEICRSMN